MGNKIKIAGRLESAEYGGYVAGAEDIDAGNSESQAQVNADTYRKNETYSQEQLNNLITTPDQGFVSMAADNTWLLADLKTLIDTAAGDDKEKADTIYRIGNWDGSQYDDTVYSEYAWDGTQYVLLSTKQPGFDDEPDITSDNIVKSKGIAATNGYYIESPYFIRVLTDADTRIIEAVKADGTKYYSGKIEIGSGAEYSVMNNPEFVRMYVDSDDKILFGIKADGDIMFGKDVPSQIKNYVEYQLKDRYYIESPEYIDVRIDADGNIIEATDTDGIKHVYAGLNISDYIEVTPSSNQEYMEVKMDVNRRIVEATKKDGTKVFGGDIETSGALYYAKSIPEWVMCFVDSNDKIVLGIKNDGTVYANGLESEEIDRLSERCDEIEEKIDGMYSGSGIMKVVKSGTDYYIRTALSDTDDIIIYMYQNVTSGGMTFHSFYVGSNTLDDGEIMESHHIRDIKDSTGAIGVSTFWFLYAQHGWTIPRMRVTTQTLDSTDIGSLWTDGSHEFYIGNVSERYIYLLPKITLDSETNVYSASWNGGLAYPESITHVSGATHTDAISGTCGRYDLKIQNVTKRTVTVNGKEITEDGTYYCDEFCISENIIGYNVGDVQTWFPTPEYGGSLIDWNRSFIFKGSMCTCNTTLNTKYPFVLTDYRGCIPQMPLQTGDYHSYSLIPKVKKTVNSHRVDIPFDSDDGTIDENYVSVYRNSSQLYNVDDQPDRCICYLKDDSDNYLVGMAGGCSLIRGISKPENRNVYSPVGLRCCTYGGDTPNKFYPLPLQASGFPNGIIDGSFIKEFSCYYCWFDPNANDGQVYWYKDGDRYILYIHNQAAHPKLEISLPDYMEGMIVQDVVENTTGTDILTQQVVSGKLYVSFDTEDDIANYIVLILK